LRVEDRSRAPERADERRDISRAFRLARLGAPLIRLVALTWRIRVVNREPVDALRASRSPVVFAFWHGEMLPLVWQHRNEGVAVLISSHRDGEIIARIVEMFGFATIRGSTSRGGGRALLAMVRALESGRDVAITPDGPRGPARKFAPGALVAAQRANVPVVAVAAHASRAWRLNSWDRFMIPQPFARVTVAYGVPTLVESSTAREAAEEGPRFEAVLANVAANAAGGAGARD
jgi:lysophospholipid acyltransferase (LPLAT)-like uncharacterized protein